MKYDIKNILRGGMVLACTSLMLTACNDFLDRAPLDQVSPGDYYKNADQLGTFTWNYYKDIFPNNIGWWAGVATYDNGTDNQATSNGNAGMFLQDQWKVPTSGGIGFNAIRDVNKFINEQEAKIKAGAIEGDKKQINQYMGEAYFIRAMLYFSKLKSFGDFPIVLKELNIDADLAEASKRMPRNLVARQILSDMDKAISQLQEKPVNGGKLRINKYAALAVKSRMALYEGTFEKYHRGTGRVPGDANWPGKDKAWNKDFKINQQEEVDFFLTQAMDAAKQVSDAVGLSTVNSHQMNPAKSGEYGGWNPYYDMFASPDLNKYPEVLMWRQFNADISVAHLTSNKLRTGSQTGWTRGLVESFLMKNGLPIYARESGYQGDKSIDLAKTNRDERLQLFVFGESDVLASDPNSITVYNEQAKKKKLPTVELVKLGIANIIIENAESKDNTGYRQRKFYNYDPAMQLGQTFSDVSGQILVRVEEAMLNYIEASYEKTGGIDATARKYWTQLRERAGITASIETTINATNMNREANVNTPSYDWGAFSAGNPINATLYSIRRERRSELAGEGYRFDDLIRWAALDQVKNYQIEGVNFWDEMYKNKVFEYKAKDDKGNEVVKSYIVADGGDKATMSSKELTKYYRPYQVNKKYNLYDGYTFYQAHYLSPFSVQEMKLCSPDGSVANTYLYQNIYWPTTANGEAEK